MVHLSRGDVREAPTSGRSFLAGETERVFDIIHSDYSECLLRCSAIGVCAVVLTEVGI